MSHCTGGAAADREDFLRTLRSVRAVLPVDESSSAAPLVTMLSRFTGTSFSADSASEPAPQPIPP